MASAHAELNKDRIVVQATYREKPLMQMLPGSRWHRNEDLWAMPLSWGSCISLRGVFGDHLAISSDLYSWAAEERERVEYLAKLKIGSNELKPGYLYAYQDDGITFLCTAQSALLADEMRLGKTRQAILATAYEKTILVVAPNSVKRAWADEFAKWAPDLPVYILEGSAAKKKKTLEEFTYGAVITNWESLRTLSRTGAFGSISLTEKEKTPGPLNRQWDAVIGDEIHRAKDPKAKQTRSLWAIGETAKRRIGLTGTPITNKPDDLWAIMHWVWPDDWPSKTKFIDRYCVAGFNIFGGLDVTAINPSTSTELFAILDPRFLRRTRADVLKELPQKTYSTRYVEMEAKQAKAYNQMADQMISAVDSGTLFATNPLTRLTRLTELANATPELDEDGQVIALTSPSCKISALLDIIDESAGESLVVFASSRKLIEATAKTLEKEKITHATISGSVSTEERAKAVELFQRGDVQVILLTIGAGGEGLTLSAADCVVFLQRPWSFAQYSQAQERVYLVGKENPIQIINLITKDTIEQRVLDVLDEKEDNLQAVCRDPHWLKEALQRV